MDIIQKLHEKIYFPLFEGLIKRRNTANYYKQACKTQWLSSDVLEKQQLVSLNQLLNFSKKYSPYYNELLTADKQIKFPLKSVSELSELPILTKELIKTNFERMVTAPYREKLWKKSTGGSTGQPLHFGYTKESYEWRLAMSKRGYAWAGAQPGTKQAYIWGVQLGPVSRKKILKESIHHFIDRQKYYNCFQFGEEQMAQCITSLASRKPNVLIGYTNPLYEFALFVDRFGGPKYKPESILCAAEKVHPYQREVLERVFGAPVFNTYGSREFMLIASECEKHEGLHVSMENLIVEVVDEDGLPTKPGNEGTILVTDLHNFGMPFIRYEIGDRARVSEKPCSCGRGLKLLDDIVGRSLDIIRTPEGKSVPGEFFPHLMKDYDGIHRFQVVQKKLDTLEVRYVKNAEISEQTLSQLDIEIKAVVGPKMKIRYLPLDEIPLSQSGKYRVTVSEIITDRI